MHSNNFIRVLKKTDDIITPDLLKRCAQDDRKAVQVFYEACFRMFIPICLRYHNNKDDARSSFHLAFMKILKNLKKIPDDVVFFPWAKRIVVNTLIDEYRRKQVYTDKVTAKETERELEVYGSHYSNDGEQEIGYEMILHLVSNLPEATSKVFNLYVIEGYSHKEIAEMLGISEGTSKWHLSAGRKTIREKLEKLEKINNELKMAL